MKKFDLRIAKFGYSIRTRDGRICHISKYIDSSESDFYAKIYYKYGEGKIERTKFTGIEHDISGFTGIKYDRFGKSMSDNLGEEFDLFLDDSERDLPSETDIPFDVSEVVYVRNNDNEPWWEGSFREFRIKGTWALKECYIVEVADNPRVQWKFCFRQKPEVGVSRSRLQALRFSKRFDLKLALKGYPLITRSGRRVLVYLSFEKVNRHIFSVGNDFFRCRSNGKIDKYGFQDNENDLFLNTRYKWVKPFEQDEIIFVRNSYRNEWVERKFFSEEDDYFWAYEEKGDYSDKTRKLEKWRECKREGEDAKYTKEEISKDDNDGWCQDSYSDLNRDIWDAMTDGNCGEYQGGTTDWD